MRSPTLTATLGLALLLGTWSCDSHVADEPDDGSNADTPAQDALARARRHLDQGKFPELVLDVKDVLVKGLPNGPLAHEAEALLEQAYELTGGNLVVDFEVPPEFGDLVIHFRELTRAEYIDSSGREWPFLFRPTIWIEGPSSLEIEQLTLTKQRDVVLLDREAGIGVFEPRVDPVPPGQDTRCLAQNDPNEGAGIEIPGLYFLDVTLTDGNELHVWFVVTRPAPETHPDILAPDIGEVLASGKPTFRFENYISPEFAASFERRVLELHVNSTTMETDEKGEPKPNQAVWKKIVSSPSVESMKFRDGVGVDSLVAGLYRLIVTYGEHRGFGPLRVSRDSSLVVPFEIAP